MEYIGILIVLLAGVFFFLYKRHSAASRPGGAVEATYVCDACGERECICRKSED